MNENQSLPRCELPSAASLAQKFPPDHILVVEDDADIRQLNVEALERAGYQVDAAEDGAVAWRSLNSQTYDLMITDQNMPRVSGLELLKKLHAGRMALPVIMATGTIPTAEFNRCPWLQPAATLLKPYTLEALLQTVQQILREVSLPADSTQLLMYREVKAAPGDSTSAPILTQSESVPNFSPRILAVDEDRDLRLLYADALAGGGYQVDFAEDGAAAWEKLQANHYDLLITEHAIPKLSGVALVRKLRAARMALPVVMTSGRLPAPELAQNPALQLAAVLWKPFTIDTLLATVQEALGPARNVESRRVSPPDSRRTPMSEGLRRG